MKMEMFKRNSKKKSFYAFSEFLFLVTEAKIRFFLKKKRKELFSHENKIFCVIFATQTIQFNSLSGPQRYVKCCSSEISLCGTNRVSLPVSKCLIKTFYV